MINSCKFRGEELKFHLGDVCNYENIFTIVVGRNGAGKSLLLRQLIRSFVSVPEPSQDRPLLRREWSEDAGSVRFNLQPTKIIASSTSPFDKFPIDRRGEFASQYEYVGLKGLSGQNLSLGYMARIISKLLRSINKDVGRLKAIMNVFSYMGYHGFMQVRLAMDPSPTVMHEILQSEDPKGALFSFLNARYRKGAPFNQKFNYEGIADRADEILDAFYYFSLISLKPRLDVVIDETGVFEINLGNSVDDRFLCLLELGFIRLRDITLQKIGVQSPIRITDASSGEQCVLLALLGIASHIEDGALICIDEPEVCLHPEWQERFIGLLIDSFRDFKCCHFIVATHSPQVVSNLSNDNCYVLDIQRGLTVDARALNNRSADFQLASVFGAPGYKNEYLTRELISALGTLSGGFDLSKERMDVLARIISLRGYLRPHDPVVKLIDLLSDALSEVQ
jgi:hypothetical protein